MGDFTHLSETNEARMVHLGPKPETERFARVEARVSISRECAAKLMPEMELEIARTAKIAGIQAAKQTALLVPLCHQVPLKGVDVLIAFDHEASHFHIKATAQTWSATGVEMEAMCAATIAAVTIYDMVKGVDPEAVIGCVALIEKKGGKKGHWTRTDGDIATKIPGR